MGTRDEIVAVVKRLQARAEKHGADMPTYRGINGKAAQKLADDVLDFWQLDNKFRFLVHAYAFKGLHDKLIDLLVEVEDGTEFVLAPETHDARGYPINEPRPV